MKKEFSWINGFKEYFAVKACPNPYILEILKEEGCGADCSFFCELLLAESVGINGEDIMFTSNDTPIEDFKKAHDLGAVINFDDISHIDFFKNNIGKYPDFASCRYNPGNLKQGNSIIGNPEDAKYGLTKKQLFDAYKILRDAGVKKIGIHTMVASNELDPEYFVETAKVLLDTILELENALGIKFDVMNLGGGIGIPYMPNQEKVDLAKISGGIKDIYNSTVNKNNDSMLKIVMEMGRMITGTYGYLVTKAVHTKDTYKKYIGVDASMADLMRPGMYGAYHHITVLGKEGNKKDMTYDIVGSLCENNDKFAIDRSLPKIDLGDLLVIHDAGAHGHAMGFNYNGKLRPSELLMKEDNTIVEIRRRQSINDYFATIDHHGLNDIIS